MTITHDEFIKKNLGKALNFDDAYGNQCVDAWRFYVRDVFGFPQSIGVRGAKDIWYNYDKKRFLRITNTLTLIPQKGDIAIWGKGFGGGLGHVGVVDEANVNTFRSFDQNFPSEGYKDKDGNFIGTGKAKMVTHNYAGVLGFLRVKPEYMVTKEASNMYQMKSGKKVDLNNPESNKVLADLYDEVVNQQIYIKKTKLKEILDNVKKNYENQLAKKPKEVIKEVVKEVESIKWEKELMGIDDKLAEILQKTNNPSRHIKRLEEITTAIYGEGWSWDKISKIKSILGE